MILKQTIIKTIFSYFFREKKINDNNNCIGV